MAGEKIAKRSSKKAKRNRPESPVTRSGPVTRSFAEKHGAGLCGFCNLVHPDPCELVKPEPEVSSVKKPRRGRPKKKQDAKSPRRSRSKTLAPGWENRTYDDDSDIELEDAGDVEMEDLTMEQTTSYAPHMYPIFPLKTLPLLEIADKDNLNFSTAQSDSEEDEDEFEQEEIQPPAILRYSPRLCYVCGRFPQPIQKSVERLKEFMKYGLQPKRCSNCNAVEKRKIISLPDVGDAVVQAQAQTEKYQPKVARKLTIWGREVFSNSSEISEDNWNSVSTLNLQGVEGPVAIKMINQLKLSSLTTISACLLDSEILRVLGGLIRSQKSLKNVELTGWSLGPRMFFLGNWISDCDQLKELKLVQIGVKQLDQFPKGLEILKIGSPILTTEANLIGDSFKELKNLKFEVDLGENPIFEFSKSLFSILKNVRGGAAATLESSSSSNSGLTPELVTKLLKLPKLERLEIRVEVKGWNSEAVTEKLRKLEKMINCGNFGGQSANLWLQNDDIRSFLNLKIKQNTLAIG